MDRSYNLKTYLVYRTGAVNWDEVYSMIIVAKDRRDALKIAKSERWGEWNYDERLIKTKEIGSIGNIRGVHLIKVGNG